MLKDLRPILDDTVDATVKAHPVDTIALVAPGTPFDGCRIKWNGETMTKINVPGNGVEPRIFKLETMHFGMEQDGAQVVQHYCVMIPVEKSMKDILVEMLDLTLFAERGGK